MKKLVSLLLAALMLLSLSPMAKAEGHEVTFVNRHYHESYCSLCRQL